MDSSLNAIRKVIQPIRKYFVELCNNSGIHGVRYLTENCLHWTERLLWLIALSVSLWLCGSGAQSIWIDWRDNPMALSFSEPSAFISEIPFPTVTICPQNKIRINRFDTASTLKKASSSLTKLERMNLNALAHICPQLPEVLKPEENFTDAMIYKIIEYIAFRYDETFTIWQNKFIHINGWLVPVLTEEGICFAYNSLNSRDMYTDEMAPEMMMVTDNLNSSDWSLEKDFQNKSTEARYPLHEYLSGKDSGFIAGIRFYKQFFDYQCGIDQGYKIILSIPGDALKLSMNSHRVPLEEGTMITIKPKLTTTSEELRKYTPNQRKCFFDGERRLRFYKIYSQHNCEAECLANFTKAQCGCVKFSMPRDRQTKICGTAKIDCYKSTEKRLSSDEREAKSFRDECNCLPACISIEYESYIERSKIDTENAWKTILSYHPDYEFVPGRHFHFSVFYDSQEVKITKRIELYTYSDFLAFCGGLLGLFLGVSALSIVELIYYSTLRLYWLFRPTEPQIAMTEVNVFRQRVSIFDRFRLMRGLRAFVVEFCDNSNIHGVLYFTRRGLHWIKRLWWIIAFGLSIWLCTSMSIGVWDQWEENPVKMIFNKKGVYEIPFPTVTICPEIKTMKRKMDLNYLYFTNSQLRYERKMYNKIIAF